MTPSASWIIAAGLCLILVAFVDSKPTIYKRNDNDKLEPVLIPVSSTVIPLPVYKVSYSVGVAGKEQKHAKPDGHTKLITAYKKKTPIGDDDEGINIKQISKEEYTKQA